LNKERAMASLRRLKLGNVASCNVKSVFGQRNATLEDENGLELDLGKQEDGGRDVHAIRRTTTRMQNEGLDPSGAT
jgi:hypothetical protein